MARLKTRLRKVVRQMNIVTRNCLRAMIIVSVCVNGVSQVEAVLDLATPEARQKEKARTTSCGGIGGSVFVTHRPVPEPLDLPLALHMESLSQAGYRVGEDITSGLRFTNVGSKPVLIPWSPDKGTVYGDKCEWLPKALGVRALRGMVRLEFTDETGYAQFIGSHSVYGISTRPDTYQTLAPGQSAVIRIWGTIGFWTIIEKRKEKGLGFTLPQDFVVRASFDLDDTSLPLPYAPLHSENEVRVKVTEK